VFAGTPVLLFGEADPGFDRLSLTWEGGSLSLPLPSEASDAGPALRLLQGSRLITDWESRYPSEEALAPLDKRKQSRVGARLIELSQTYGLASREMSLVAVVKRAGDRPGELPETRVTPVGMPQDVNFGAYFPGATASVQLRMASAPLPATPSLTRSRSFFDALSFAKPRGLQQEMQAMRSPAPEPLEAKESPDDKLLNLAAEIEPDGGMPGATISERILRSIAAMLAFVASGHTLTSGAFRTHLNRLASFLKSAQGLTDREKKLVQPALEAAAKGSIGGSGWIDFAHGRGLTYEGLAAALKVHEDFR
jgi:hypothetical protein